MPVASREQYLGYGQYMNPAAFVRPDMKPRVGLGARPKTTAGQTTAAWTNRGSGSVLMGRRISKRNSSTEGVGHVLSGNFQQPEPLRAIRECPPVRTDAPTRSTPIQSPMFYQDPSTGFFVPVYNNIVPMQYVQAIPDGGMMGFNAEARGTNIPSTNAVDVLQVHPANRQRRRLRVRALVGGRNLKLRSSNRNGSTDAAA